MPSRSPSPSPSPSENLRRLGRTADRPVLVDAMRWRCRRRIRLVTLLMVAMGTAVPQSATSDEVLVEEVRVKAAYLHKFSGFVEWPAPDGARGDGPYLVGVAGSDAVFLELERVSRGRLVQGRPVEPRRVRHADRKQLAVLHVLFVGRDLGAGSTAYVKAAEGLPVLTVGEDPQLQRSVALNFVNRDGHVRFEVSLAPARLAGLTLSSRLLAVADRVHGGPRAAVGQPAERP